ncbi:hypothetical protein [Halobaculum sp. EA56]|uniref:hypothetical protein n=1 Tax=Halobaculum sp. EA56 TaxID=3421648 RepID=UPI003EBCAE59
MSQSTARGWLDEHAGRAVRSRWSVRRAGIAALVATKGADIATTLVGLRVVENVREVNPIAAAAIGAHGPVVGLFAVAAATVLAIVLFVEGTLSLAATSSREVLDVDGRTGRVACYGAGAACNLGIAAYNAAVVLTAALVA